MNEIGIQLLAVGTVGFLLWRRAFTSTIIRIRDQNPPQFDEWVAQQNGQPGLLPTLQLVYRKAGAITLILSLLFLLAAQVFIGVGLALLFVDA